MNEQKVIDLQQVKDIDLMVMVSDTQLQLNQLNRQMEALQFEVSERVKKAKQIPSENKE